MKTKLKKAFGIILYIFLLGFLIIGGINDLANKKNLVTVELEQAVSLLDVEHSVNGLIPIGTSHYYLGIEKNTNNVYVIGGFGNWLNKDFAENKTITAPKKRLDYEVEKEIISGLSQIPDINVPLGGSYYIMAYYKVNAALKLVLGLMAIVLPLIGIYFYRHKDNIKPVIICIYSVIVLLSMLLLIYVTTLN